MRGPAPGVVRVFGLFRPPIHYLVLFVVDNGVSMARGGQDHGAPFLAGVSEMVLDDPRQVIHVADEGTGQVQSFETRPVALNIGQGTRPCDSEAEALRVLEGARADYLAGGWRDVTAAPDPDELTPGARRE